MADTLSILNKYWGFSQFRPLQQEIINAVLAGQDALALLPTGGGKSICFQVPAMATDGICIVISPLIALMKDQVENLKKKGILAAAVYSGMSRRQIVQTLKNLAYGPYKFLYVSPERLETALFLEYLPALQVNLIAVDEAHCISQWGYDFRPSYLRIAALREHLPNVPVLALTASATTEVQKDICQKLGFKKELIFRQSFERKNLSYSAFAVDAVQTKLVSILTKVEGTGIVYCKSRKRTVDIANLLQMHGISAQAYHAGLSSEERSARQQSWIDNKTSVMVCTNAFGMGIDKPDVRVVVHADAPDCLENYYQEAGRAGRDGQKAYAVLLYNDKSITDLQELHHTRFPTFDTIKKVYDALVNHLQIPVHTGQDVAYTFKFETFIKNFLLDGQEALYALKALESDGWLDVADKSFTPSAVGFTTSKQFLYEFQAANPLYDNLTTTLLRTYEGIFDYPVFISELFLAKLLRKSEESIKGELAQIARFGIIQYAPQNDAPRIIFRKNRVAAKDLIFNHTLYNKRKETFVKRTEKMVSYIKTNDCRSHFVNVYFGDEAASRCGICDNCLRTKATSLSAKEFDEMANAIKNHLSAAPLAAAALLEKFNSGKKDKVKKVIHFLQAEQKVGVNANGKMYLVDGNM